MAKENIFSLWYGRSRSKARSLHENKLLSRKLQHGHRWSHANWQIIKTKKQNTPQKGKTQIPRPDLRLTFPRTAKQTAKGARAQQKQPQKDLPKTQWYKPTVSLQTQKHAANELVATQ